MRAPHPSLLALLLLPTFGCTTYIGIHVTGPSESDPAAVIRVETNYVSRPGPLLHEGVHANNLTVYNGDRLYPGPTRLTVGASFYEEKTETTYERVPHEVNKSVSVYKSCVGRDYHGDCESGYVYEDQSSTEYRDESVTRTKEIDLGSCEKDAAYRLDAGRTYTLKYTFVQAGECSLECTVAGGAAGETCTPTNVDAPTPTRIADASKISPLRPWGGLATTLGFVGLALGGAAGAGALVERGRLRDHCDAHRTCDAAGLDAASLGGTFATVSTVSLISGFSLLVTGIVLLALPRHPVKIRVVPDGAGELLILGEVP